MSREPPWPARTPAPSGMPPGARRPASGRRSAPALHFAAWRRRPGGRACRGAPGRPSRSWTRRRAARRHAVPAPWTSASRARRGAPPASASWTWLRSPGSVRRAPQGTHRGVPARRREPWWPWIWWPPHAGSDASLRSPPWPASSGPASSRPASWPPCSWSPSGLRCPTDPGLKPRAHGGVGPVPLRVPTGRCPGGLAAPEGSTPAARVTPEACVPRRAAREAAPRPARPDPGPGRRARRGVRRCRVEHVSGGR